ncbi:GntR family transcriptional regulator [Streptomyces sp. NPDC050625]|uniref:GntR family transcriptional regulator n=1 Tax=Streptomyces sp. NPDC050625 TaxID=3154629 RepID=UPI00343E433E
MSETQRITTGAVPKHEQLRDILAEMCTSQLSPGDPLPSERQLCLVHGVSRITVREAIGQLESEGLVTRVRGKGTFVAERTYRSELHLASFSEDMRQLGLKPGTVVLSVNRNPPPPQTAAVLGLLPDQDAYHVRRLRLADGSPISVDDAWYAAHLCPGLESVDLTASIYDTLATQYGHPVDRAEQTVGAGQASTEVSTLLGIRKGGSVLTFDRVAYSGRQAIEHTHSRYRADRYQLRMSLSHQ